MGVHRDEGNREDRKHARLKYVIARKGLPWFRAEVEARTGITFEARALPPWHTTPVLGWLDRTDGTLALGLSIRSGRIGGTLKAALREVVATFRPAVQLSPDQDLILLGLRRRTGPRSRPSSAGRASRSGGGGSPGRPRHGLRGPAPLRPGAHRGGAGPAGFPRGDPQALARQGRGGRSLVFRVTGCANGCARPYTAELALVGQTAKSYALYAGGDPEGTRLAFPVAHKLAVEQFPAALDRLFAAWAAKGQVAEAFGDFAARVRRR